MSNEPKWEDKKYQDLVKGLLRGETDDAIVFEAESKVYRLFTEDHRLWEERQ